jgi:YfiH family protein
LVGGGSPDESGGPGGSAIGRSSGDAAWEEVARAIDVAPDRLLRLHQVHGRVVVIARPDEAGRPCAIPDADIVISSDPSLAIAVQSADCVPLLIVDPETGVVAAAHAGWRGMAGRVAESVVEALARTFSIPPERLLVAAGPSIGACCYEVGPDVKHAFEAAGFSAREIARWFLDRPTPSDSNPSMPKVIGASRADRWYFDGWASTRDQLLALGVLPDRMFGAALCTASHPGALCSYRRDGSPAGRMAAVIRTARPRP